MTLSAQAILVVNHLKSLDVAALVLDTAMYAVFGLLFYYVWPVTTPGLGLVRFWPQVIIPAVFAVIFGPWVGGAGAAMGIFINDMFIHGNPVLSLMAGVTSNFAMFWIIGYIASKDVDWKIPMIGCGIISALLVWISYISQSSEYTLIFSTIVIGSYVSMIIIAALTRRWRSFEWGSMLGLLVGSTIIGTMVPVFSYFFIMPGNTALAPLSTTAGLSYIIWTFSTEIPFLIIAGPPILWACYRAFPSFDRKKRVTRSEGSS